MASQMGRTIINQVAVDINQATARAMFRATGSVVVLFNGWLKIYQENQEDGVEKPDGGDGYGNVRLHRSQC